MATVSINTIVKPQETGKQLCDRNPRFHQLVKMCAHPEFQRFIDDFMGTWSDCKENIMYIKLARYLTKRNPHWSGYELAYWLHQCLTNKHIRQHLCKEMVTFSNKDDCDLRTPTNAITYQK